MPQHNNYLFQQANNANNITERRYFDVAHNQSLTFPGIDSCIAMVFAGNNRIVGFHLVLEDSQNPAGISGTPNGATAAQIRQSIDFILAQAGITADQNTRYLVAGDFNNEAWRELTQGLNDGLELANSDWQQGQGNLTVTYTQNNHSYAVNWTNN